MLIEVFNKWINPQAVTSCSLKIDASGEYSKLCLGTDSVYIDKTPEEVAQEINRQIRAQQKIV